MPGIKRIVRVSIYLSLVALFAVACSNPRTVPVLEVGDDYKLPIAEYKSLAVKRFSSPEIAETEPLASHEAYLEDILIRQLKVIDGRHRGFDEDPAVQEDYEAGLERAAITKLYNDKVLSEVISEEDMHEFYKKDTKEVHASHILISAEEGQDDSYAKALIDSLYQLAKDGADFAELASRFNDDKSTVNGDIGWFRRGVMVVPFEEAVFSLKPDQVSAPVKTRFGWHIVKLHEVRKVEDRPEYLDDKDRISQQLARQRQEELVERASSFIEGLRENRSVQIDTAKIDQLMKTLQGRLTGPDVVAMLTEEEQQIPVVTLDHGQIRLTMDDMRESINRGVGRSRNLTDSGQLIGILNNHIAEHYLLPQAAREAGSYNDKSVVDAAKDAADRRIYQIVQQNLVSNRIEPTDEETREYFEQNPQKYMIEAQYTLIECLVDNKQTATEIFQRANAGENLRDLANQYTKRVTVKDGVFGPIRRTQYGAIGRLAADSEIGALVGPVRIGTDWSVFRVISKEEPRLDEFDKVKSRVRNDLRMEKRQTLEKAWLDSLKQNIRHKINMNVLKKAYPNAKVVTEDQ